MFTFSFFSRPGSARTVALPLTERESAMLTLVLRDASARCEKDAEWADSRLDDATAAEAREFAGLLTRIAATVSPGGDLFLKSLPVR